ncbi:MAG: hypothetical protein QOI80_1104 [Solirubrobacteraceae bacterium]|jgi:hypothetical protein|nr:hypothetical protein [Solirubrobacteraceae bacterium]
MRRLSLVLLAFALLATPAEAKPKRGLKVYGFSVNTVFISKGTTVPPTDSTNACYRIGGPSGAPQSLTGTVFVRAIKIPKSAVTHFEFHTPWDKAQGVPESDSVFDGPFKNGLFRSKPDNLGGAYGGPTGQHDYYHYRQLPTGTPTSYYMAGTYTFKVTAKVGGKTYSASGKITLQCA